MNLAKIDAIKINFIVGTGRSGTTLLSVIFNEYANCISSPEIHHFVYFYKKYSKVTIVTQELIDDIKKFIDLFYSLKKNPLFSPYNSHYIDLLKAGDPINYSQLIKLIYLGLYGDKGIKNEIHFIVDKNPFYTFQIDKILNVFPDANIIALIRDYRAYALSIEKSANPKLKKKTMYYHALLWNLYINTITKAKEKYGNKVKIIKYENLVSDNEASIKEAVTFFGLNYSDSILNFPERMKFKMDGLTEGEINPRLYKRMSDLTSPINTNRLNAWEGALTVNDIKILDFFSSETGAHFNYTGSQTTTFFEKLSFIISAIPDFIKVKVYELLKSPDFALYYNYKRKKA